MKLLILAVVMCVANATPLGGLFGGFGSAVQNAAADVVNGAARASQNANRNRNSSPVQDAAQAFTDVFVTPAKIAASAAANAVNSAATSRTPVTRPVAQVAPSAPRAVLKPVTPAVSPAAPAIAVAEAVATATASARGPPVHSDTAPTITETSSADGQSEILRYEAEVRVDGFHYAYETSNGISVESNGETKNVNGSDVIVMNGYYQYIDTEGSPVLVTYTADEEGFHPQSDILPTPPPVPEDIAAAIRYILSLNKAQAENAAQ